MLEYAKFVTNRSILLVRPRQPFLDWCKTCGDSDFAERLFESLNKSPRIFLLDEYERDSHRRKMLHQNWREMFAIMLQEWRREHTTWPGGWSYKMFRK